MYHLELNKTFVCLPKKKKKNHLNYDNIKQSTIEKFKIYTIEKL